MKLSRDSNEPTYFESEQALSSSSPTSLLTKVIALVVYAFFFATFLWLIVFLIPGDVLPDWILALVPHTLDTAPAIMTTSIVETAMVVVWDLFLLHVFAVFHSIFARRRVKEWMGLPKSLERTFFVFQSALSLAFKMYAWRNIAGSHDLWNTMNTNGLLYTPNQIVTITLVSLYLLGVLVLLSSTFALDHFHLFGLSQGLGVDINAKLGLAMSTETPPEVRLTKEELPQNSHMVVRWHYKYVAHPIMTGFLMMVWLTPRMTTDHFVLSVVYTLYIHVAVRHFEERDLSNEFGPAYTNYLSTVPRFIPGMPPTVLPTTQTETTTVPTKMSYQTQKDPTSVTTPLLLTANTE